MAELKAGEEVAVIALPICDVHGDHQAEYDCSIIYNGRRTWAYICQALFDDPAMGAGLGMGRGQRLVVVRA